MADWTSILATVKALMARYGRSITVQKLSSVAADATKPWRGAGTPTVVDARVVNGCFVPVSSLRELGITVTNDEGLARSHQLILVEPTVVDLRGYDMVLDGGVRWNTDFIEVLQPGDTVVLYAFGVSR